MFSIQVMGGLGNQLFQIFTALAYSLKHDIRLLLPKNKHDEIKRPSYWDTFLKELNPILVDQNIPFRLLQEKGFEYVEIPKKYRSGFLFLRHKKEILIDLSFNNFLNDECAHFPSPKYPIFIFFISLSYLVN